jgi:uncharacterized protein YceK
MDWNKLICIVALVNLIVVATAGCGQVTGSTSTSQQTTSSTGQSPSDTEQTTRPAGWTEETHGNDAEPDYEIVPAGQG